MLYSQEHVDTLLGEIARLELRVRSLEQERAKARVDALIAAARIADSFAQNSNRSSGVNTAAAIAARLRTRAAVGVPQEQT